MSNERDRLKFWETHWQRCRKLGMTLKEYAEKEGLTVSVLYGWSKRFKREEAMSSILSRVTVLPSVPTQYRLCFPNGLVLE
ncbi:MAG: hypothetical protein KDI74_16200 [Gammaproteobacteria bacterium]|nr:hypothetical protein [Gammaproteobacteria bacterium]